jgi:hypothetical protein
MAENMSAYLAIRAEVFVASALTIFPCLQKHSKTVKRNRTLNHQPDFRSRVVIIWPAGNL